MSYATLYCHLRPLNSKVPVRTNIMEVEITWKKELLRQNTVSNYIHTYIKLDIPEANWGGRTWYLQTIPLPRVRKQPVWISHFSVTSKIPEDKAYSHGLALRASWLSRNFSSQSRRYGKDSPACGEVWTAWSIWQQSSPYSSLREMSAKRATRELSLISGAQGQRLKALAFKVL